jgi:PAS domain S-box-containing protein
MGLTPVATLGRSIYEVARGRLDLPKVHTLLEQLDTDSADFRDIEIEYQVNGTEAKPAVHIFSLNARRLATPDRKELVLLAFQDITERKLAAEARYRRLFESARDGIVLVDANGGEILDLNPFTEQLLGYTRDELAGRKLWEIEPLINGHRIQAAIDHILDHAYLRIDDLPLRAKDGRTLQTEMIANVYSEGERRAIQFNIRDVSERRKFERELQETQKLESLGLLAGGIAHDFNNLLTGILGNASLASAEMAVSQKVRLHLREIVQAGERAAFLTRQMLAYAGRGRFVIETIDLGDLIKEISALIRTSIPKTVELRLDLTPNLPPIEADPAQIQQVVMNLIINAAEAIGENAPGKVEIRTLARQLSAEQSAELFGPEQSAGGAYVQFEVNDTGCGMDEATRPRIFDPFFTTKFTGRGLGLAAVQGILRRHRGVIRVFSTPGQGSSFLILFPAKQVKQTSRRAEPARIVRIPPGKTALIVDDEETIRTLVENVLSREGMKILTADNGKAAAEIFREHHAAVSVVLLDLQMPVMGGEEAFRLLSQVDPDVPVILSSGYDQSEAAGRFSGRKPASFLQKPYTTERLIEAMAATLGRSKG